MKIKFLSIALFFVLVSATSCKKAIEAIKEQQKQIEQQSNRIATLEKNK